jgi:hypothetical protein
MIVNAVYKIKDDYVVGDDKCVYRLSGVKNNRKRSLKKLKEHRGGYFINGDFIKIEDIKYEVITPYVLIDLFNSPFK